MEIDLNVIESHQSCEYLDQEPNKVYKKIKIIQKADLHDIQLNR